ncbi:MAG: PqiC family protein [Candidatus Binatia bacterium]|nr:PqiC family protein [Candidatus Binatia bacterium]
MIRRAMDPMRFAPLLVALFATGCSLFSAPTVTPTRFFVLTGDRTLSSGTDSNAKVSIGVGPFTFPRYLSRKQMVRRTDPNQVVFSQFNKWAEPVEAGFLRVMAENIGWAIGTSQVLLFPWYEIPLEYQVKGEVLRFETNDDSEAVLECVWTVYQLHQKKYLVTRHADLRRPITSDNPDDIAATLSALTADLAREIGRTVLTEAATHRR